jgi:hypothetical protein
MKKILIRDGNFQRVKNVLETQGITGIEGQTIKSTGEFFLKMDCPPKGETIFSNGRLVRIDYTNTEGFYISVVGGGFEKDEARELVNQLNECNGFLTLLAGITF